MSARNSRPCSRAHAAATYATDHCTTLRRRSLAQMLWSSRSAGVSFTRRPPWRRSVAASDPVAGVNWQLSTGSLEASAITASARRNPQRRSPGASASRRAGNLETWDPAARSRTPQVARIPDFQFLAPAATSAGATGGRGSGGCGRQPGELETWNSGIRAARRGAGRRGPAVARSARVGRTRAAAMASPMARRRASLAARREVTSEEAPRVLAKMRSIMSRVVTNTRVVLCRVAVGAFLTIYASSSSLFSSRNEDASSLLRHLHVEFDRRELLGGHALTA